MTTQEQLHLVRQWVDGAVILAGLGVPPRNPVVPHRRHVAECEQCQTWCCGASLVEAESRLAEHERRCHA